MRDAAQIGGIPGKIATFMKALMMAIAKFIFS
jgi:hypothetical protein